MEVTRGVPRSEDKIVKGEILQGEAELNPSKLPAEIQKGLEPILINFQTFSKGLVSLFDPLTVEDVKVSIANLKATTTKAKDLTDKFDIEGDDIKIDMALFNETMENLSQVSKELKTSLNNFEDGSEDFKIAMKNLKDLSDKINNGEGSAGKFINEDELYNNANDVLKNLDSFVKQLMDDPSLLRPSIWK